MKRFIIIITFLFSAVGSMYVLAQEPIHEFSVYSGLGFSSLRYQLSQGTSSGGFGGDFGLGYTYYRSNVRVTGTGKVFYEQWGIFTGIGFGLYNAKSKLDGEEIFIENLEDKDEIPDRFDLRTTVLRYKEVQRTMYLNIPVMAQFQIERYYILTGLKFGVPLIGKYKLKEAMLLNGANYPEWHPPGYFIYGPITEGLGEFDYKDSKGKFNLGVSLMLSLEGGVNWRLTRNFSLYSGAYFDFGLNNAAKKQLLPFAELVYENDNNSSRFTTNSALTSFTEKVKIMAVGVKVRLAYVN